MKEIASKMIINMSELVLIIIFPLLGMSITSIAGVDIFFKCLPILILGLACGVVNIISSTKKDIKIKKLESKE